MIYITRRETFCAAHRMCREEWSDEKNLAVFGKCSNPAWHGHNYVLNVTVRGEIQEELGFFINLTVLKKIIQERILEKVDHRNINTEVSFMNGKIATTENLAIAIWNELKPAIEENGAYLHRVKISETENNTIEYYG